MIKTGESTKIVCTIGPASEKRKVLEEMLKKGMDVARLNFSHGTHEWHQQAIINLRMAAFSTKGNLGIMADLQGPRIRVASLENKGNKTDRLNIDMGEKILLKEKDGKKALPGYLEKQIKLDYSPLLKYLKKGEKVFLDNGMIELTAKQRRFKGGWEMEAENQGVIGVRKGINLPTLSQYIPPFTKKDKKDLSFALRQGVDFIALSFVKKAKDIQDVRRRIRKILGKKDPGPMLIAKIETTSALQNLKEILNVTDGILVARGDLGVEADPEKVPIYQKLLLRHCTRRGIPSIVATNMLESMVNLPRPTRAELTDVANAVIDRTDAVMLSGETANGKYPIRAVEMMSKIVRTTEKSPFDDINRIEELDKKRKAKTKTVEQMAAQAVYNLVAESNPKAVVTENIPTSFITYLSSLRPPVPIRCLITDSDLARILSLYWGVTVVNSKRSLGIIKGNTKNYILVKGSKKKGEMDFQVKLISKE